MNKLTIKILLMFAISVTGYALDNVFSLNSSVGTSYEDSGYNGGDLNIQGSDQGGNVQLRIETFKKVGSSVQLNRFVTNNISKGTQLPTDAKVYKSNNNWQRVGSRSQGKIKIDVADGKNISGELFENSFNATLKN